uniref:Methyl-accepting chemotaxis sensory transducer n=1 Tax=Caulobacter sp. (strain K31) TaxID=366602 RepID=B0T987_CAUSK
MALVDLKVSKKILSAFAALIALSAVGDAIVLAQLRAIDRSARLNDQAFDLSSDVRTIKSGLVEQQNAIRGYVMSGNATFLDTYRQQAAATQTALDHFASNAQSPGQREQAEVLKGKIDAWRVQYGDRPLALSDDAATHDQAMAIMSTKTLGELRTAIDALETEQARVQDARFVHETQAILIGQVALALGAVLAMAASLSMARLLGRLVAAPIVRMTQAMRRLAQGDLTIEVPDGTRGDELGEMAAAVEHFKAAAIEKLRLEGESREVEAAQIAAAKAEATRQQAFVVDALAQGLEKLAAGELTWRVNEPFPLEYEKLRGDFNAAMGRLQETMGVIARAADGIRAETGEISQAADDLSARTERQAASLEQTAAALDQVTATVRRTADWASQALGVAKSARGEAQSSGGVVRDTVGAMGRIERSSQQIGQITGLIDEIAFQTNLLALNAGVEAARAGDAGRGFAVVAQEVRALAQRSAEAAKEIKALIAASSDQVAAGANLVGQTGAALERIVQRVGELDGVIGDIAASAQEQALGLQQVNTAVNQMDQITQQNAAMVEQSTAASHGVAREAEGLSRLMGGFQLDGESKSRVRPRLRAIAG